MMGTLKMRGRIVIRSIGLKDITVQFKAENYNGIILKGREVAKRRARGFLDKDKEFHWCTEVMNRRMQWQIVEMGNEQDLKARGHQIPGVHGMRQKYPEKAGNSDKKHLELQGEGQGEIGEASE